MSMMKIMNSKKKVKLISKFPKIALNGRSENNKSTN